MPLVSSFAVAHSVPLASMKPRAVLPHGFLQVPAADRHYGSLHRPSPSARRLVCLWQHSLQHAAHIHIANIQNRIVISCFALPCFHSLSQKAGSLYRRMPWPFSRRSRFMERDLFNRKRAQPQKRTGFDSVLLLVFNLTLYAFRIFDIYT